jgi:Domain of unknown function (DUF222)/HNH endonuclease
MSGLRSALETLQAEDLSGIPDDRLETDFDELQRAAHSIEAERLRRLAEIHRRQSHRKAGYLSTASWLVDRHRLGWTAAAKDIRTARSLQRMPRTREALATGQVTGSAVQMLVYARQAHPAQFHGSEEALVEAARRLPAPQLHAAVSHWKRQLDWDQGLKDAERLREGRRLKVTTTLLGMVRMEGELDAENGEVLMTALRDCDHAQRRARRTDDGDAATATQRRVDALGEICRQWLNVADRPIVGGERPHVTVTVSLEALQASRGEPGEMDHVGPVPAEMARRLSCDAAVRRVVLAPSSEPLDIGRKTAVIPAGMRRAVIVRDRHCRFPGCDRPHSWCDVHHVVHWADGGATALSNLVLLCRRHHRMVHEGGAFRLTIEGGRPVFRRAGGVPMGP